MNKTGKPIWRDGFLLSMVTAVLLASLHPDAGRSGGQLHIDAIIDYGIAAVFFLHGMGIPGEQLRAGLARWPLHLMVQGFTFGVFPLLGLILHAMAGTWLPPYLMLGFFYLCALPSTISSSVAMTGAARGNVPAAVFNATLSSLLGIVLTPLLITLVADTSGASLPLRDAIIDIARLLLLPFLCGQLLHHRLGRWFARYKPWTNVFDKAVIVLLVYTSFCDSVAAGLWRDYGAGLLLTTLGLAALLLAVALMLTWRVARLAGLPVEDEIVAVFCGSKKTLASGVPMAKVLFGSHPGLGLIVLPIMFYHQLQLLVAAVLAERYARRA